MLRALTESLGSCERLVMSDSVKPSDKYSISLLPLAFTNGSTAIDSICVAFDARRAEKQ